MYEQVSIPFAEFDPQRDLKPEIRRRPTPISYHGWGQIFYASICQHALGHRGVFKHPDPKIWLNDWRTGLHPTQRRLEELRHGGGSVTTTGSLPEWVGMAFFYTNGFAEQLEDLLHNRIGYSRSWASTFGCIHCRSECSSWAE